MSAVTAAPHSPFKGLAAFGDSDLDALFFFGRERERAVLLANLLAARVTVLYGESGVGKSSLLAAAVVRDLREASDALVTVRSTWSGEPAPIADGFEAGGDGFLILDQFEEYFLYHGSDGGPLLGELPELLMTTRVNVLIALREDALARLDAFKAGVPAVFANQVRLAHLEREQARRAILGPLARWEELFGERVDAEPAFVETVVDDVSVDDDRVEAPYLQLVLERVWDAERDAGSDMLRRETLVRLGGAAAIVRDQFHGALESLPPEEQDVAAAMFEHLVTPTGTKIALRTADLAQYAQVPEPTLGRVLDRLTRERVVRAVEGSDRYEIFHDVLAEPISSWRVERQLIAERGAARRRQRQLLAIAATSLVALAVVAGLAIWAFSERTHARDQARHAEARELDARALQGLSINANKSVRLALSALWLEPTNATEAVLRQAMLADRLRLVRHAGAAVRGVATSPNGKLIAVALGGGRIELLDARNRRLVRTLDAHRILVAVSFVDDGRRVLAATASGRAEEWEAATGQPLRVPPHTTAARVPDGSLALVPATGDLARALPHVRRLVAAGDLAAAIVRGADGHVRAELFRGGRLVHVLPRIGIQDIAISPDGTRLATAAQEKGLTSVWDAQTGLLVHDFEDAKSGVDTVAFSPDGTMLASGGQDSGVRIWDLVHHTRTYVLFGHTNPVDRVMWSPDGHAVVSSDSSGSVLLWRMRGLVGAGSLAGTLAAGHETVGALAFSPDSTRLVTGSTDGLVRIWDVRPDPMLSVVGRARGPALAAGWTRTGIVALWPGVAQAFDHGRRTALRGRGFTALGVSSTSAVAGLGSADGTLTAWDTHGGRILAHTRGSSSVVAVAAQGRAVAGGARDGTVTVLGKWSHRQRDRVTALAFSPDGALLTSGGAHGVTLWDARRGTRLHAFRLPAAATAVALSPDGRILAAAGADGVGRLWFTDTGHLYRVLRGHTKALTDIGFSPDGHFVVTSGKDNDARIWNVDDGNHYALQRRSFGPLRAVAFDSTGRWVVGAAPISAILWNATSGRWLFYVRGHEARVTSVSFSPIGETVLTSSEDGTVRTYACQLCASRDALVHAAKVRLVRTR